MYVVTLAILIDKSAQKFVYAGIEYLKAFVILRKDFLQCFNFLLQCVKARHIGGQGNVTTIVSHGFASHRSSCPLDLGRIGGRRREAAP